MKRFATAIVIVLFALTGCGSSNSSPHASKQQVFIKVVTNKYPELIGSESELIGLGHNACDLIDSGATTSDFVDIADSSGFDIGEYGYIVGAAVRSFCPENQDFVTSNGV